MERSLSIAMRCIAVAVLTLGCQTTSNKEQIEHQVIDQPTPPGIIEPPRADVQAPKPYRPYGEAEPAYAQVEMGFEKIAREFADKYAKAKKPRIALYVNRVLDGDVREWQGNTRVAVGYGETVREESDGKKTKRQVSGGAAISVETRQDAGAGVALDQTWAWRLEDAIRHPLIQAGAHIVDRKIIMRLAAADIGGTAYGDVSIKTIEMAALKGSADILAQVAISRTTDPKHGYLYRLEVFDINTGRILLSTSSANWPRSRSARGELVSTSKGFERSNYANPQTLGNWLARDLMAGLISALP